MILITDLKQNQNPLQTIALYIGLEAEAGEALLQSMQ
jgi:hypothetical protein